MMELAKPIRNRNDALTAEPIRDLQEKSKGLVNEHETGGNNQSTMRHTDDAPNIANPSKLLIHIRTDCYCYILWCSRV